MLFYSSPLLKMKHALLERFDMQSRIIGHFADRSEQPAKRSNDSSWAGLANG